MYVKLNVSCCTFQSKKYFTIIQFTLQQATALCSLKAKLGRFPPLVVAMSSHPVPAVKQSKHVSLMS